MTRIAPPSGIPGEVRLVTTDKTVIVAGCHEGHDKPLFAGAQIDLEVLQIFEPSYQNCHSERTE